MGKLAYFFAGAVTASIIAVGGGFAWFHFHDPTAQIVANEPLPATMQFTDLHGRKHTLQQWRGKLLLINFWATWCVPCRKEIPYLVTAQKRFGARGLQIIGPAVDDPDAVRKQLPDLGIDYPVMTGTPETMISLMDKLGNQPGGLPFSVLVGPDGRVIERHLGAFDPQDLYTLIKHNLPG